MKTPGGLLAADAVVVGVQSVDVLPHDLDRAAHVGGPVPLAARAVDVAGDRDAAAGVVRVAVTGVGRLLGSSWGSGAATFVPTTVTSSTGSTVTFSPATARPTSTPPRVRTVQVTVLLPARPAVRTTFLPVSSRASSAVRAANGMAMTSVTVVVVSAGVVGEVAVGEVVVGEVVVAGEVVVEVAADVATVEVVGAAAGGAAVSVSAGAPHAAMSSAAADSGAHLRRLSEVIGSPSWRRPRSPPDPSCHGPVVRRSLPARVRRPVAYRPIPSANQPNGRSPVDRRPHRQPVVAHLDSERARTVVQALSVW